MAELMESIAAKLQRPPLVLSRQQADYFDRHDPDYLAVVAQEFRESGDFDGVLIVDLDGTEERR